MDAAESVKESELVEASANNCDVNLTAAKAATEDCTRSIGFIAQAATTILLISQTP